MIAYIISWVIVKLKLKSFYNLARTYAICYGYQKLLEKLKQYD